MASTVKAFRGVTTKFKGPSSGPEVEMQAKGLQSEPQWAVHNH